MKELKLGVQMMMLREQVAENGPYEVMKKLNDMGFKYVEISQIEMSDKNIDEFNKAFEDFGMSALAISAPLYKNEMDPDAPYLMENVDVFIDHAKRLNSNYIRIGMIPFSLMNDKEGLRGFSRDMEKVAGQLKEHGIKLYYHNHHIEFTKLDGEYILDLLLSEAPSIGYELDVHWVHRGGFNPVDVINRLSGKVDLIHLKDYKLRPLSVEEFDFSKRDEFMSTFTSNIQFAEVGDGNLDFKEIIKAGIGSNVEYYIIEQDDTYGKDPYECLKSSKEYLDKLASENNWKFI